MSARAFSRLDWRVSNSSVVRTLRPVCDSMREGSMWRSVERSLLRANFACFVDGSFEMKGGRLRGK